MRSCERFTARVLASPLHRMTTHYVGLPPGLASEANTRREMGDASVLIIEHQSDGVFLLRYSDGGLCVGDTWHFSIEDAKEQAEVEFEGHLSDWELIPQ